MSGLEEFIEKDNETNSTSIVGGGDKEEEVYYQKSMEFIFEVVLLMAVGILGLIGNISAIVLFSRLKNQLKFHQLMMTLSAFDTLYVVVSILLFALPQLSKGYIESGAHHYILPKALPFAQIALTGSIYSTLAITVERYLTVCHPFYTVSHRWTAKHYVAPIVAFSFLYNLPKFFELYTSVTPNDDNVTSSTSIEPTSLRVNDYYIQIYCIWMNFVFMGLGPFVLLIVLNLLTFKGLTRVDQDPVGRCSSLASSQPSAFSSTSSKKNEMLLAKVSLTIVFIFILCHSVKWIPNIFELLRVNFMENKRAWPPWVESVTHISHFLTTLNSSVNFYVYCFKHFNVISACWSEQEAPTRIASMRRQRKHLKVCQETGSLHRYSKNESEDQVLTVEHDCAQV